MSVGSLYYIDAAVTNFTSICDPKEEDLTGRVKESRSWEKMQEDLEQNGRFSTKMTVDLSSLFKGDVGQNYVHSLHATLTEVFLEEIPLVDSSLIFQKLMARPECDSTAMYYIRAGGYVCQGQKILRATAEFKLDRDTQSKIATEAKVT